MKKRERRKHGRFPVIESIHENVLMYLSPPLIQDPISVTILELSAGGMSLETTAPLPTRFLFTIVFTPRGMKKIYAEGKAIHVLKTSSGFKVGIEFTRIDPDIYEKINQIAHDVQTCNRRIEHEIIPACRTACRYYPLCHKKEKIIDKIPH